MTLRHLVPSEDLKECLGTNLKRWKDLNVENINVDHINGFIITQIPAPNAIVVSRSSGTINPDWIDDTIARSDIVITAGEGLVGGGNLRADRTIDMGVPTTLSSTTINRTYPTSHEHEIDLSIARSNIQIIAGDGLTDGGDLTADRTINMGLPTTLSIHSVDDTTPTSHTHKVDAVDMGSIDEGLLRHRGMDKVAGYLYSGVVDPDQDTRINYDGHFHSTQLFEGNVRVVNFNREIKAGYGIDDCGKLDDDVTISLGIKYITPQDFGALGDAWNDDTDAFNQAIEECKFGYVLYIPKGAYRLKALAPINFAITIIADKKATLFFNPDNETDVLFDISHPTGTLSSIVLQNLFILPFNQEVNTLTHFGTAFKISDTSGLLLSNIKVMSYEHSGIQYQIDRGLILKDTYQTRIDKCDMYSCAINLIECLDKTSELHISNTTLNDCWAPHAERLNVPYVDNCYGLKLSDATGVYLSDVTIYSCMNGLCLDNVKDLFATQCIVDACGSKNTHINNCNGIKFENSWFQGTNYYWEAHPVVYIKESKQIHIVNSYVYDGVYDGVFITESSQINLHNNTITQHGLHENAGVVLSDIASGVVIHNSNTIKIDNCFFTEGVRHTGQTLRNKHAIKLVGKLQDVKPFDSNPLPTDVHIVSKNIIITNNYIDPYIDITNPNIEEQVISFCPITYDNSVIKNNRLNIQIKNNYGNRILSETSFIFSIKKTSNTEVKYKLEPLYMLDKEMYLPPDIDMYYDLVDRDFIHLGMCKRDDSFVFRCGGLQSIIGTVLKPTIIQPIFVSDPYEIYSNVSLVDLNDINNSDNGYRIVMTLQKTNNTIVDIETLLLSPTYSIGTEMKILVEGIFI